MLPKQTSVTQRKGKQPDRQASVGDENDSNPSEGTNGENQREDGQLVSSSIGQQVNPAGALPSVPSFSEQQIYDLVNIVHSVI